MSTNTLNLIKTRIFNQLNELDWDFPQYMPGSSKAIHWYPGTFPAELPFTLIQGLTVQDDIVLDPYGGVGTTAIEALRLGRKAWAVELNPVAILAAYVSGSLVILKSINDQYPLIILKLVKEILDDGESDEKLVRLVEDDAFEVMCNDLLTKLVSPTPKDLLEKYLNNEPNWLMLESWFEQSTLNELKAIYDAIVKSKRSSFVKLTALSMLSAVIRPSSSQIKSWGHIADNVRPKDFQKKSVFSAGKKWLSRTSSIVKRTEVSQQNNTIESTRFWVSQHNWTSESNPDPIPDLKAKALITSPPYADAIDYIFAQRLSLYLFGYTDPDIQILSGNEIGARRKRTKTNSKTTWADELVHALSKQVTYLKNESLVALVLPHKESGRDIGAMKLEKYLTSTEWQKSLEIDRSIRQLRTRQSWTSIKKETIQIYQGGLK